MEQNFENHRRFSKIYHFTIVPISLIVWVYFIYKSVIDPSELNIITCLIFLLMLLTSAEARMSALKAQDRSIVNEVRLRYLLLTKNALPENLRRSQIIALRFAPDTELVSLVDKSVAEELSATEIKKNIKSWKADNHRV